MLTSQFVAELNDLFANELCLTRTSKFEKRIKGWHCPIQSVQVGEYIVVPLTSARKVKSEGYLMQNCVKEYVEQCRDNMYLLFSIRNLKGERVATLGVKKEGDRWYFDDCLGKDNSTVMEFSTEFFDAGSVFCEIEYTELFSVAHEVVRLINTNPAHLQEA